MKTTINDRIAKKQVKAAIDGDLYQELLHRKGVQAVELAPTVKPGADAVLLLSEASLAESWLTPEDDHWDAYYQELCIRKEM